MDKEYISVSAFSKRHNINKRKVYELIQQEENKRYVLEKDGVKYIYAAMPLEAAQKTNKSTEEEPRQEQEVQDMPREVPQEVQEVPQEVQEVPQNAAKVIEELKDRIRTLEGIIEEKDKIIVENTNTIVELLRKQQELTEKALQIANQSQVLQALPHKKQGFFKRLFLSAAKE